MRLGADSGNVDATVTLNTLIASGLVLFAITLVVNMGARAVISRQERSAL